MTVTCELCRESFTRATSLKRHMGRRHGEVPEATTHMYNVKKSTPKMSQSFVFKHPFTMILGGPTGVGKTQWAYKLIAHARQMISPVPRRILYFYSQWQPLYAEMQKAVKGIEFVRNIPTDMDSDTFFDPDVPCLLFIDDLMTDATRNESVCNLFTRGSHHLNVSVVCLMQNLFYHGKENRTMSLNAHYMVLFKNPRDRQQIGVLARQMYPGNSKMLLDRYVTYTERPYGYLLVDLKPETPEADRLITDVFPTETKDVKPAKSLVWNHESDGDRGVTYPSDAESPPGHARTYKSQLETNRSVPRAESRTDMTDRSETYALPREDPQGYTCADCGVTVSNVRDLQRHLKEWCTADGHGRSLNWRCRNLDSSDEEDEPLPKRQKQEDDDFILTDTAVFVIDQFRKERDALVNRYVQTVSRKAAEDEAYDTLLPKYRKVLLERITRHLVQCYKAEKSALYRRIKEDVMDTMLDEHCDYEEATLIVLKKRKHAFDKYLEQAQTNEDESVQKNETELAGVNCPGKANV